MTERRHLRQAYRSRRPRRRPKRFCNRRRKPDWIAPSQLVLVRARLKMLGTLRALYPLTMAGVEDVRFDHRKRWGKTFSTVEIGKARLHQWYLEQGINARFYQGWETKGLRLAYGYRYYDQDGKRHSTRILAWVSASYLTTYIAPA